MSVETKFERTGTLQRPGTLGRAVRFVLGLWITYLFFQLVDIGFLDVEKMNRFFSRQAPSHPSFWIAVLIFFWIFPYVLNIGFRLDWRRKPQWILLGVATVIALAGYVQGGGFWSPVLAWLTLIWLLYVTAHLGFSLLLAAVIATPGCEMRAFPNMWTRLTGRETAEHYCPGFLDSLDRWELRKRRDV